MRLYFFTLLLIITTIGIAQNDTFKGLVLDNNYEPLAGAIIKIQGTKFICGTDDFGLCQIASVPNGVHIFHASYIGNSDTEMTIEFPLHSDSIFTFVMRTKEVLEDTIDIYAKREIEYLNLEKRNWKILLFDSTFFLINEFFVDENNGWVVGGKGKEHLDNYKNGIVLHTSDGGLNWETQLTENNKYLRSVFFINPNTGYVVGDGPVYKTTNAGREWISQLMPAYQYVAIYFENENTGYLRAYSTNLDIFYSVQYLFTTFDGGINWNTKRIGNENEYQNYFPKKDPIIKNSIQFELSNNLLRVSKDNGNTWIALYPPALGSIFFVNDKVGYAISPGGMYLLKTITGGE